MTLDKYIAKLNEAFDARVAFEAAKNADNLSIQAKIASIRSDVTHETVAKVMLAANVDVNFINRAERKTARFNVYSAEKVSNVARASVFAERLNHFSKFILLTAKAFAENDLLMTQQDAMIACSHDAKSSNSKKNKHIVKYAKSVAISTQSTQASSSINALQMFDVLRETRDDANNACFVINHDSDVTKALLSSI